MRGGGEMGSRRFLLAGRSDSGGAVRLSGRCQRRLHSGVPGSLDGPEACGYKPGYGTGFCDYCANYVPGARPLSRRDKAYDMDRAAPTLPLPFPNSEDLKVLSDVR